VHTLRIAIGIAWALFWVYWLVAAIGAKRSSARRRRLPFAGASVVAVILVLRVFRGGSLAVESPVVGAIGAVLFVCGLGLAIWARIYLGRNWGMPMTEKAEPELVTSGPYRFVRHPIYSGLLLAVVGTALVTNLVGLVVAVILGAYFYYSARTEEKNLTATFPTAYPAYRMATKMLIPFVL
jgi:protein-S-isoprenylcysteine O-methyltransferase Ste14